MIVNAIDSFPTTCMNTSNIYFHCIVSNLSFEMSMEFDSVCCKADQERRKEINMNTSTYSFVSNLSFEASMEFEIVVFVMYFNELIKNKKLKVAFICHLFTRSHHIFVVYNYSHFQKLLQIQHDLAESLSYLFEHNILAFTSV